MMEQNMLKISPDAKAKYALAEQIGGGRTPESIILTQDLPRSYPLEADGRNFLSQCGFSEAEIEWLAAEAYK